PAEKRRQEEDLQREEETSFSLLLPLCVHPTGSEERRGARRIRLASFLLCFPAISAADHSGWRAGRAAESSIGDTAPQQQQHTKRTLSKSALRPIPTAEPGPGSLQASIGNLWVAGLCRAWLGALSPSESANLLRPRRKCNR
ncbi:hypothetical protein KUCAC02_029892, partial [Chaenocephalus aceratus]